MPMWSIWKIGWRWFWKWRGGIWSTKIWYIASQYFTSKYPQFWASSIGMISVFVVVFFQSEHSDQAVAVAVSSFFLWPWVSREVHGPQLWSADVMVANKLTAVDMSTTILSINSCSSRWSCMDNVYWSSWAKPTDDAFLKNALRVIAEMAGWR